MTENRWISDLHWRRDAKQGRAERTQSALLEAAEALLLEQGTDATTVADIARSAGVSVGAFYHHFKDKTALFYALFHQMTEHLSEVSELALDPDRWSGASICDILRGYLEFSLRSAADGPVFKTAAMMVAGDHPDLFAHYTEINANLLRGIQKLLLQRSNEIGHVDPKQATGFILDQLAAMLWARHDATQREAQLDSGPDEKFVTDALAMARAYLHLKPETPPTRRQNHEQVRTSKK